MLHRKIYQLCTDGREVSIFLRDQQRWIDNACIVALEGDLVTIRYETEEDDEISSWEEMVRLESIGAVSQKLASVSRINPDILVADDEECPEAEQIRPRSQDANSD
ncbi:conserved hypothetical protein [Gloeothece citriformis PCC 7424]|uniref:Uncharacterized protein n=1 Tax=Gloeothece citriformis (strain PCC 7424) TaxID=65393 RepID=B7K8D1_GLOC7|nr:DUF6679 family protein [Gloeothece citriformis]ACK69891.1 conserved hypothetical protein [Gloeothece citriformis PCC 7424]